MLIWLRLTKNNNEIIMRQITRALLAFPMSAAAVVQKIKIKVVMQ
jgi:hypothetical protein